MSEFPVLKDQIDTQLVVQIADRIVKVYSTFDRQGFVKAVDAELYSLELKPRFGLIADKLFEFLPDDYPKAIEILVTILESDRHEFEHIDDIGFRLLPIPTFVEKFGINHFQVSMDAMYIITRYTSCEFAIRPFIMQFPEQALDILNHWVNDENEHVRRLVSEGSRPRLPWASQLPDFIADPTPTLEILAVLQDDPSLYVRRSVANHLNDITKDHPERVLDTLEVWQNEASEETHWLINHALRTLVKKGHPRALELLGFSEAEIDVHDLRVAPQELLFGDALTISFSITSLSDEPQNLMIDFIMHFMKANGKTTLKVFKLKQATLSASETLSIKKSHSIRPISTRKYYGGQHHVDIQVNGQVVVGADFELIMPDK